MSNNLAKRRQEIEAVAVYCGADRIEDLRRRFMLDLTMTPDLVSEETGAPLYLVTAMMVAEKWMEERRKHHQISADAELLRYRELVLAQRIPTVTKQLDILDGLHRLLNRLLEDQENSYKDLAEARERGESSEVIIEYLKRTPSAKSLNELATAIEKASATAGRLLNIRENLFAEGAEGLPMAAGTNLFILPGAQPSRTLDPVNAARDVTPYKE